MAKKVTVTLVDDVDGKSDANESVEFGIDGVNYEIDLSSKNAENLRNQLSVWVAHARRVSRYRSRHASSSPSRKHASMDRTRSAAIREWATRNGHTVSSRGRIPAEITDAFNAASPNT